MAVRGGSGSRITGSPYPVKCPVCKWYTKRVRSEETFGWGVCNKCPTPTQMERYHTLEDRRHARAKQELRGRE